MNFCLLEAQVDPREELDHNLMGNTYVECDGN